MSQLWRCLETPYLDTVPAAWRMRLGDDYDTVYRAFLRTMPGRSTAYPCPRECGCGHEIIRHPTGRIVAVCRCEEWNCDDIPLTDEETMILGLNRARLSSVIARAFGLVLKDAELQPGVRQIGVF